MNEKHLDYIQGVINRLNSNSFLIKGWTITLTSALFAASATLNNPAISLIAIFPILLFWILDSIYISNERCYISLYEAVTNSNQLKIPIKSLKRKKQRELKLNKKEEIKEDIVIITKDYSMNIFELRNISKNNWYWNLGSRTIWWFYLMLLVFSLIFFSCFNTVKNMSNPDKRDNNLNISDTNKINIQKLENIKIEDTLKINPKK